MVAKEEHTKFSWEISVIDILLIPMFYNDPEPSKDATGMTADWQGRSREERYKKQNCVLEFLISFVPRVKETYNRQ